MIENTRAWKMTISTALSLKVIMTRFVRALARLRQRSLNTYRMSEVWIEKLRFLPERSGYAERKNPLKIKW